MKVSELYAPEGPFVGHDIHIVGSGPSMSVFPVEFLEDKTCILLNDSCRWFPTLGPIAYANNKDFLKWATPKIQYRIVKGRLKFDPNPERDDNHCSWDDPNHYVVSYTEPPWEELSHHDERTLWRHPLYYWAPPNGSCSAFAVQFALYAGARSITMVGCDCCPLNGEHYTKGKKNHANHDYMQYAVGLARLAKEAQKRGVPMMSLTPFFGLGYHGDQYKDMLRWPQASTSK